jgi:uncharacterized membrane-anchored protein YitT (DUF2179 family)
MRLETRSALRRELPTVVGTLLCAVAVALGLHVFVYRADFAPAGVDGLATMLQYLSGAWFGRRVSAGVFTLALNLPLLVAAWFVLRRRFVLYTLLYTSALSVVLVLLSELSVYQYDCLDPASGNSAVLAAVFGGCAQGLTGYMLRIGASSGGVDIAGAMLARRHPGQALERIISCLSYLVVALSLLVYGNLNAVCLSCVSIFACERVSAAFLRSSRGALRCEMILPPDLLPAVRGFVTEALGRGLTLLPARGGYGGGERICAVVLIGHRQLPELLRFAEAHPDLLLSYGEAAGVRGRFDRP